MSGEERRIYRIEVWITAVCFAAVSIIGGFFSAFVVLAHGAFFDRVPSPEGLVERYGAEMFVAKEGLAVLGFPLHYFLLIVLSWIGATVVGAIWCVVMDKLEARQRL